MIYEVYDIECISNCFTYTGYDRGSKLYKQFVIHYSQNDFRELIEHLRRDGLIMIGYNNMKYDYPILHHLLNHYDEYIVLSGLELAEKIYAKSQAIIDMQFSEVAFYNIKIPQIDLMLIWHFDNVAKMTSLKSLEFAMNLDNVEDMPFEHNHWVVPEEIPKVLSYNKNDVFATDKFLDITLGRTDNKLYSGKDKIALRTAISKKTGINMINYNDIKMGTELILDLYCRKFGFDKKEVRKLRSPRESIALADCLPKWTSFKSPEFKALEKKIRSKILYNTKGEFSEEVIFHGIKIYYGTGGAHASIKPGVYVNDKNGKLKDGDVNSLYPSLGIEQGTYPEHLGKEFLVIYDGEIVSIRLKEKAKPKKEQDLTIVEGYKLAANGSFGKTNSEDSYLYDPLYTMKITISGQIFISMWMEKLVERIPGIIFIQVNTDGITAKLPIGSEEAYLNVAKQMTEITGLTFEFNDYDKMVIRDVNNYSARYEGTTKIKHKGCFEINKELHKDSSMKIVPIALEKYFFDGIPLNQTITTHKNIYDYCLRLKVNSGWQAQFHYLEKDGATYNKVVQKLSKTTRYYISTKGGSLYKKSTNDSRITGVNIGYLGTIFNKFEEKKDYGLNYGFYIAEANKIVNLIEDKQLSLF